MTDSNKIQTNIVETIPELEKSQDGDDCDDLICVNFPEGGYSLKVIFVYDKKFLNKFLNHSAAQARCNCSSFYFSIVKLIRFH